MRGRPAADPSDLPVILKVVLKVFESRIFGVAGTAKAQYSEERPLMSALLLNSFFTLSSRANI